MHAPVKAHLPPLRAGGVTSSRPIALRPAHTRAAVRKDDCSTPRTAALPGSPDQEERVGFFLPEAEPVRQTEAALESPRACPKARLASRIIPRRPQHSRGVFPRSRGRYELTPGGALNRKSKA